MMANRIVNNPDYIVEDMLRGFVKAHPDLVAATENPRVLKYAGETAEGKVGIVTGGGSGHKPAFIGYIGKNMCDAVAVGEIFSSPTAKAFEDAFMAADQGSGVACLVPAVQDSLNNGGAHGFSEVLYAYSSVGGNNGSAFAGFNANTPFLNVSIGLVMLFARFLPMVATLAIAGSLAEKKKVAASAGTLSTSNAMFVFLLIFVVLLVGALSFFPALALGPAADFFQMG